MAWKGRGWLCCWRNLKRFLFGLACLATLFALFHVVENVRGRAAWRAIQREAAAKSEPLTLAGILPPPVPDAENMAMAPIFEGARLEMDPAWRRAHTGPGGLTNTVDRLKLNAWRTNGSSAGVSTGRWIETERTDLTAWQRYYRTPPKDNASANEFPTTPQPQSPATDVLLALSKFDPIVAELREASRRPHSRFPVRYEDTFNVLLPHLAKMKACTQFFALRSIAELAANQPERALEDVRLAFRLADSIRDEPLLISQLDRWSDAQLAALEGELAKFDLLADYERGMRGERVCAITAVDYVRQAGDLSFVENGGGASAAATFRKLLLRVLVPLGWFDQNKVALARLHLDFLGAAVNPTSHTVSPEAGRRLDGLLQSSRRTPYNFFTHMLIPALSKASARFARGQASLDQARVACALERYRLAKAGYPETLDALAPAFIEKLPCDVITGQPLKYRQTDNGQFALYSIGWNEKDDGGEVALTSKGNADWSKGDWAWRYPAK